MRVVAIRASRATAARLRERAPATQLEKRRPRAILEHVSAAHVPAQHVEALVPRLVGDAQQRCAALCRRGDEPGQAVARELRGAAPNAR